MSKYIYIILATVAIFLLGFTGYYIVTHNTEQVAVTSSEQPASTTPEEIKNTKTLTTKTGKVITVSETNPVGESLSTITITSTGFASNSPIILEKNKLMDSYLFDMNNDTYDELILVTVSAGSGSYGEVDIFTTTDDLGLKNVTLPRITEELTEKGQLFEGYMGHDSFTVSNGKLIREFPTYKETDTSNNPTGPRSSILYTLTRSGNDYSVTFQKNSTSTSTSTTQATYHPLSSTSWTWVSYTSGTSSTKAPSGEKFVLTFAKDNRVTSTTDCNSLAGTYKGDKTSLQFSPFAMTLMFCENSQESIYSSLLSKATKYTTSSEKNTLIISLSNKEEMLFILKK